MLSEVCLENICCFKLTTGGLITKLLDIERFRSKRWIESWICWSCRTGKLRSRGRIKFRCPRKVGTLTLVFVRKGVFEDVNCAIALKVVIHYHKMDIPSFVWICRFLCFKYTYVQVRVQEKNPDLKKKNPSFCGGKIWYHLQWTPQCFFLQELIPSMDDGLGCFGLAFHGQCTCPCREVGGRLVLWSKIETGCGVYSHHDCWKKVGKWNWSPLDDNDSCYTYPLGGLASPCNIRLDPFGWFVSRSTGILERFMIKQQRWSQRLSWPPSPAKWIISNSRHSKISKSTPPKKNNHCQEIASSIHHFSA